MMWLVLFGTISSLFVFLSIIIGCGKKQIAQTTIASRNLIKSSRSSSLCSSSSLESGSVNSEKRYLDTHLFRRPVKRTRIIQKTAQQLRVQAAIEADRIAAIAAHQSSQELENQGLKRVIEVNPREIMFKSVGGVKSAVVQNKGNEIYVFRIKCSDSDVYEVDPICSYVEPRSSKMLKVMRFNAADKIDYLTLVMGKVVEFSGNKEQDWENTVEREEVIISLKAFC